MEIIISSTTVVKAFLDIIWNASSTINLLLKMVLIGLSIANGLIFLELMGYILLNITLL